MATTSIFMEFIEQVIHMANLTIYKDNDSDTTVISNRFIDEYMSDANDAQLKIYLYLIRCISANIPTSISDIADKFNHTEKDVLRALKYWEKTKLISLDFNDSKVLIGIHMLDFPAAPKKDAPANSVQNVPIVQVQIPADEKTPKKPVIEKPSYSLDDLKTFKDNEETQQLLFVTEQYLGKTLSPTEIRTILFINDKLSFSTDLIDYLVQYCIEKGKKDFRYIEKVAISWAEEGISTVKQAKSTAKKYDKTYYSIMKALGKTSFPTDKELSYINRWINTYALPSDIIMEACDRTVMATDRHRFEYADSILTTWHKLGVKQKADIIELDENFKKTKATTAAPAQSTNKYNQFQQNSYDYDVLEKELLSN